VSAALEVEQVGEEGPAVLRAVGVEVVIRGIGSLRLWRQHWAPDTRDLHAHDPAFRVLMVVLATVDNR
jgi:hypothetical protein